MNETNDFSNSTNDNDLPTEKTYSSFAYYIGNNFWQVTATLITIATIMGNIFVIFSVFTHKPLKKVQNYLIVSLAVADLTVAILVLPPSIMNSKYGEWVFGDLMCKMWLTCDVMCCTASILSLCAIALDRYYAVTKPFTYGLERRRTILSMIAIVWALSIIISSLPLLGWNNWPEAFDADTPCRLSSQPGFVLFSSSISFFIPSCIICSVYLKIFLVRKERIKKRAKKINTMSFRAVDEESNEDTKKTKPKRSAAEIIRRYFRRDVTSDDNATTNVTENIEMQTTSSDAHTRDTHENDIEVVGSTSTTTQTQNRNGRTAFKKVIDKERIYIARERKAARDLGIITGIFVFCWAPFFILYIIMSFFPGVSYPPELIYFVTWLGYINSNINPYLYTFFNQDFRKAFRKLLGRKENPP